MKKVKIQRIKFAPVYNRSNGKLLNADGTALVQIRCYQNGRCRFIPTGVYVAPHHWDDRNKKVKNASKLHLVYNRKIWELLEELEAFEEHLVQRYGFASLSHLERFGTHQKSDTFTKFCSEELERPEIEESTRRGHRYILSLLASFQKEIHFNELNYDFVTRYDRFLRKRNLKLITIDRHHRTVKSYIEKAITAGLLIDENPYKKFKRQVSEPDRIFLTRAELQRIEQVVIPKESSNLEKIRQFFLFLCYTGLRYSDASQICYANVEETVNGMHLHIREKKTKKAYTLPVGSLFRYGGVAEWSEPEKIIRRAQDEMRKQHRGTLPENIPLFRMCAQSFNREVKKLAAIAGVKKKVSSHVGRRTFATLLSTKIPSAMIQKLLNHSNPNMTQIYIQLTNPIMESELKGIDWNL